MHFDPFAADFHADPYPTYRRLRDDEPVHRAEHLDCWVLSRYADVVEAHRDWATYSSRQGPMIEPVDPAFFEITPMLIAMDPPRHTEMRRLVSRVFTPARVTELEPAIAAVVARHLGPLREAGAGDLVADFTALVPPEVIFTLLGVPTDRHHALRHLADTMLDRDADSPRIPARAVEASIAFHVAVDEFVTEVRADPGGHPGLVADLLGVPELTQAEVVGFCGLLGAAGSETVARLVATALVELAERPDLAATVRADRTRIPDLVEEVLRWAPPSQIQARTATRDVTVHGTTVAAGDRVLLLTGAACHDEREYDRPDEVDLDRPAHLALGFGHGVHVCLGASLARAEARIMLGAWLDAFAAHEVDRAAARRVVMTNVHGWASVPFSGTGPAGRAEPLHMAPVAP